MGGGGAHQKYDMPRCIFQKIKDLKLQTDRQMDRQTDIILLCIIAERIDRQEVGF